MTTPNGHFSPHSIKGFMQAHGHDPELDKPQPEPTPREPGEKHPVLELAEIIEQFHADHPEIDQQKDEE